MIEIQFLAKRTQYPDYWGRVRPAEKDKTVRFDNTFHLYQKTQGVKEVLDDVKKRNDIKRAFRDGKIFQWLRINMDIPFVPRVFSTRL